MGEIQLKYEPESFALRLLFLLIAKVNLLMTFILKKQKIDCVTSAPGQRREYRVKTAVFRLIQQAFKKNQLVRQGIKLIMD